MEIRKTTAADLDTVMNIYATARDFMRKNGNVNQWTEEYPPRFMIEQDISNGESYLCEKDGKVLAVFMVSTLPDPTYDKIDGAWLNDDPYCVIHRIARTKDAQGVGAFCINWCFEKFGTVRIDTHKDNEPMLKRLENLGFIYCGIIWLANGDERLAFQKI
ncbi:MAG: GNAT family N-acetyltransferase [Defluviitaleaceae bacterium]|nr:GNAT family N-acetyltransferase [Defluviitaleaceae bacterium]